MRLSTTLLILPALAVAQEQKPLLANVQSWIDKANVQSWVDKANVQSLVDKVNVQAWFDTAKSYVETTINPPTMAASSTISSLKVTELTASNWQSTLKTSSATGPENWMILISGGNKTCGGECVGVEEAWNKTATVLAADPSSPKMGYINCDNQGVLCTMWFTSPPALWYLELPAPAADQSRPATMIHAMRLNATTTTAQALIEAHTKKVYEQMPVNDNSFHPFDGWLARYQLLTPIGYVLHVFGLVPSWALMLAISFGTRTMMNRRLGGGQPAEGAPAQRKVRLAPPMGGAPPANE